MNGEMESIGVVMKRIMKNLPDTYREQMERMAALSPKERIQKLCDSDNGIVGNLNEDDGYDCPICKNRGYIAAMAIDRNAEGVETNWREVFRECKCKKTRAALHRLSRSGLGDLVKNCRFENFTTEKDWQKRVKAAAMAFVKDDSHNMFFFGGSNGGGKTTLCTAIAMHYLRGGREVSYMSWKDDVAQLNACVNEAEEYERLISRFKEVDVLYIDDFLKIIKDRLGEFTRPSEGELNRAYEIINYRYRNPKFITIISSERYLQEIMEIDEATGSRIYERTKEGYCYNVKRDPSNNYRLRGMSVIG